MPPVEDARKHRRLRESLSHRLDYRCSKPFAVDAVDDEVRFLRACTPQQTDQTAVAIIYLHAEAGGALDLFGVRIDDGHRCALRHDHLPDRLADPAIADPDRPPGSRNFLPAEPVPDPP